MRKRLNVLLLDHKRGYPVERQIGQRIKWKLYDRCWHLQLFIEEVERQCNVTHYGKGYPYYNSEQSIVDIAKNKPYDVAITNIGKNQFYKDFNKLKILKVIIAGDLYNGGLRMRRYRKHHNNHYYDLMFCYSEYTKYWASQWGYADTYKLLPFSVDINLHQNFHLPKRFDVMACFTSGLKEERGDDTRYQIKKIIKKMPVSHYNKKAHYMEHVWRINQSRICLNHRWHGFINPRYFEVLACGGFLLTDMPEYDLDITGFVPGKHFETFRTIKDLKEKVLYWLDHPNERNRIARQGMRFVRKYHSTKIRVKQMIEMIRKYL